MNLIPTGLRSRTSSVDQYYRRLLIAQQKSWVNDNRNLDLSRSKVENRRLNAYGRYLITGCMALG
ncbi:MAG: hypothetical protein OSA51_10890 [Octadecabacter sp.]|nr:hypothetical protein [Octadecabacter sp.]